MSTFMSFVFVVLFLTLFVVLICVHKKISHVWFVITLCILAPAVMADSEDKNKLKDCSRQCSSICDELAQEYLQLSQSVLQNCGDHGGRSRNKVISYCATRFGSKEAGSQCARDARSVEVINACINNFGSKEPGLNCVSGASSPEVINVCAQRFGKEEMGNQCAREARSVEAINTCIAKFGRNESGLNCAIGQSPKD